jgi:ParB-like chromosome segregation protein Spo0J
MLEDTQSQPQSTSAPPKRLETRDPKQLKSHPLQNNLICDLQGLEYERLKSDLEKNGQSYEIEISADDVIIDGHQRNRIALELGWPTVKVWVRDDLADQAAIDHRFLQANLARRHMSKMEKARCYQYMIEQEQKQAAGFGRGRRQRGTAQSGGDYRDRIGKMLGCSGRTLDRLVRVLKTPIEVFRAFEKKKLTLQEAGRVADLSPEQQAKVAEAIRSGKNPRKVVTKYAPAKTRPKRPGDIGGPALNNLKAATAEAERVKLQIEQCLNTDHLPFLQDGLLLFLELAEYIEQNPEKCRTLAEKIQDLAKGTPSQVRKPQPATVQKGDQRPANRSRRVTK